MTIHKHWPQNPSVPRLRMAKFMWKGPYRPMGRTWDRERPSRLMEKTQNLYSSSVSLPFIPPPHLSLQKSLVCKMYLCAEGYLFCLIDTCCPFVLSFCIVWTDTKQISAKRFQSNVKWYPSDECSTLGFSNSGCVLWSLYETPKSTL